MGRTTDIVIVGAGIVGCSVARELSRYNASVLGLESGKDIAEKAYYNVSGAEMYPNI